jgi:hypothetical protein
VRGYPGQPHQRGLTNSLLAWQGNTGRYTGMGTPIYALRLPQKVQDDLSSVGRVYGSLNGRAFAREILEVVTSADADRISQFVARFTERLGGQTTFFVSAVVDAEPTGKKRTTRKARKKRKPRDRTT